MSQPVALKDLRRFCEDLIKTFSSRQVVRLDGPLGAGKTQFVKACVEILGGETPDSPTFSVINSYQGCRVPVYHVDLYRLESAIDIESTGFWDLFLEKEGILFIEWSSKVPENEWPQTWDYKKIHIHFLPKSDERLYEIT